MKQYTHCRILETKKADDMDNVINAWLSERQKKQSITVTQVIQYAKQELAPLAPGGFTVSFCIMIFYKADSE